MADLVQYHHHSSKILVTGKSGSGKTTYGLRYLTNARYDYRFIFDGVLGQMAQRLKLPACHDPRQLFATLSDRWTLFDPTSAFPNPAAGCMFFCDWVFHVCGKLPGKKLIVIDELWKYTSATVVPPEMELVVFTGRLVGIDCLFMSQRPNRIHNSIRDALSELVCFRLQDKNSLKFLIEQGIDDEPIRELKPGQFIAYNLDNGAEERGAVF